LILLLYCPYLYYHSLTLLLYCPYLYCHSFTLQLYCPYLYCHSFTLLLSIFILSFLFVIVYGLFEWKRICACFLSFVYTKIAYILLWEIQFSRWKSWDPINRFNTDTRLCPSQARTKIFNVICRGLICVQ
jgi:hypothetical protein